MNGTVGAVGPTISNDELKSLVASHHAGDRREQEAKNRFLLELDRLAAPCDEHSDPVHVTASAIVLGKRGMVMHLHRRLGRWMQPGGHIDPGEAPTAAVLREVLEETGLMGSHPESGPLLLHLDVHEAALGHVHLDLRFVIFAPDDDPVPGVGESPEVRWCSFAEARALADPALTGALERAESMWRENLEVLLASSKMVEQGTESK